MVAHHREPIRRQMERREERRRASEPIDLRGLERALRQAMQGEVRFDEGARAFYAVDGSNYRQPPLGVVLPRSIDDVVAANTVCREYGAPLLSRGAGTSLAGQCCNVAVVMDFSKYLTEILAIDADERTARVRPGTVCDALRERTDREHHLVFGPDPATHKWCTFGGMLGNNSCGVHAVLSGRTADNVKEMEILTYDGARFRVGSTSEEELQSIIRAGSRRGEIYRGLQEIRDQHAELIRARYPQIPRRVSGYNLDELLPERGFNVARALVGTEGTCATILEATVELVHSPPGRSLLVLGYPDVFAAADHVPRILEHGPTGLEGLDRFLVEYMKKKKMHPKNLELLPEGHGWLLVELGGETQKDADDKARELVGALEKERDAPSMQLYDDPEAVAQIWEIRESGLGATARVPGMSDTWPGWEDAAVHPERLGDYLRDFRALLDKYDYQASLYGHFGQGCVHCRINFDLRTHGGIGKYGRFLDDAAELVIRYDGSFSGEHGDGQARGALLPRLFGDELMGAFRKFKGLWDPDWKMNPGKVIDPDPPTTNLRLGTDYRPWQPVTHFHYPDDEGSFSRAVLRCVGVGKCRRRDEAFMCPSFIASHDEEDTTRGRAHVLFEMLEGEIIPDGWRSEAVKESLDLCLGCKGCKKECPVNVDMATYKSEFLSHHYQGRLRPREFYALGLVGRWARLGARMPSVANFFGQTEPFSSLLKWTANVSQDRQLPSFAAEPFTSWASGRLPTTLDGGRRVVVYPDLFNDCFHPETLRATAQVLERLGYDVLVPPEVLPAIRPLIHYGMLPRAKRALKSVLRVLRPYLEEGLPIVGVEPSTVSVFRDELAGLMPHDQDAIRLSEASYLLSEFLDREDLELPRLDRKAILHGHCHQKAVLDERAVKNVLRKMGVEFSEPQQGCCGMAGSFGLETEHYQLSVRIGEENLLPAIRAADSTTLVVADGFSCRSQIREGTGRQPLHLAELLLIALEQGGGRFERSELPALRTEYPRVSGAKVAGVACLLLGGAVLAGRWMRRWMRR